MVKKILLGLVAVVVVLLVVVALQPNEFRIERSTTIDVPPAAVFEQVNDLHKWDAWSPWAKLDPNAKNSFEGAESGEGAIFKWAGNDEVGEGKMTIVESKPNEKVNIQLDFLKPFESTSNSEFIFAPEGEKTKVTWAMYGKNTFMGKAMCLVMNMDKMMGSYFETGLGNLKRVAEEPPQAATNAESGSEPAVLPTTEQPKAEEAGAEEAKAPVQE